MAGWGALAAAGCAWSVLVDTDYGGNWAWLAGCGPCKAERNGQCASTAAR